VRVTIHQPEHLPWLGFFAKAASSDRFVLLDTVPYRHGYFQNRNRLSHQGELIWLTVPVQHRGHFGDEIRQIRIIDGRSWQRQYVGRLEDALRRAPHRDEVIGPLREMIDETPSHLADLNVRIIRWLCELLDVRAPTLLASELGTTGRKSELLAALCQEVGADVYLSGPSGRDYLDLTPFHERKIEVEYFHFVHPTYPRDPEPWTSHLSAIDLVASVGRERAGQILQTASAASRQEPATR
jgi:hypothetical protein